MHERTSILARRVAFALVFAILLAAQSLAQGTPYGPFANYEGLRFPATAAGFAAIIENPNVPNGPVRIGYFFDTDGDGKGDVERLGRFFPPDVDSLDVRNAGVSPSDPDVFYVFVRNPGSTNVHSIVTLRLDDGAFSAIAKVPMAPGLTTTNASSSTPNSRKFDSVWVGPVAYKRIDGHDTVLATKYAYSRGERRWQSTYALYVDGPDADPYADHWTEAVSFDDLEAETLDDRGNVIVRRIKSIDEPFNTIGFLTVRDTDGNGTPEDVDESSFISAGTSFITLAYGPGDIDSGADRFYTSALFGVADLDSRHKPRAGSLRILSRIGSENVRYVDLQDYAGRDGNIFTFAFDQTLPFPAIDGIYTSRDNDFDGFYNNSADLPAEFFPIAHESQFPSTAFMQAGGVADLTELPVANGAASAAFADFGEFPNHETFHFRFGGQEFDRFTVGTNGTVRFGVGTAPAVVTGAPSFAALAAQHGVVAPAWSNDWDTSQLHVFAGYVPVQQSFATGGRTLGFAVEWRSLRAKGWAEDRAFSMRLLLMADGTFRTDYGAMEGTELTDASFVAGYAGPGAYDDVEQTDASAHSWGSAPAGTRSERVLGEEFTAAHASDVGHLWVRWMGYPERLDPAGPAPEIVNPAIKKGKKLVLGKNGSNIEAGATVTVDGTETFALAMNKASTKWVVGPHATSTPGAETIAELFAGGGSHTLVVTNPDGGQSQAATLP